jgi:hypothetical protein
MSKPQTKETCFCFCISCDLPLCVLCVDDTDCVEYARNDIVCH